MENCSSEDVNNTLIKKKKKKGPRAETWETPDFERKEEGKEPELKTEKSKEKGFEEMRYYEPWLFLFSHLSLLLPLSLTLALLLPIHASPLSHLAFATPLDNI